MYSSNVGCLGVGMAILVEVKGSARDEAKWGAMVNDALGVAVILFVYELVRRPDFISIS